RAACGSVTPVPPRFRPAPPERAGAALAASGVAGAGAAAGVGASGPRGFIARSRPGSGIHAGKVPVLAGARFAALAGGPPALSADLPEPAFFAPVFPGVAPRAAPRLSVVFVIRRLYACAVDASWASRPLTALPPRCTIRAHLPRWRNW